MTNRHEMNRYIRHLHLKQQGMKQSNFNALSSVDKEIKRERARELANKITFLEELRKEMVKIDQKEALDIKNRIR